MSFNFVALKKNFFDAEGVKAKVDPARRRVMGRMGAFVRTRARSSIRPRRASAPPGKPPSSHAGQLRLIFFAYDPGTDSVVVGPVPFRGKSDVPGLLERGGDTTRRTPGGGSRRVHYAGNPFMGPAGRAEAPKFTSQLRGMVR